MNSSTVIRAAKALRGSVLVYHSYPTSRLEGGVRAFNSSSRSGGLSYAKSRDCCLSKRCVKASIVIILGDW